MEEIKAIVSEYDSNNIFNMDETNFFYRSEPNRTLVAKKLSGMKKQNERIIVALIANATSSICLPPPITNRFFEAVGLYV